METNIVNVSLLKGDEGLGFNIRGGKDAPYILNEPGIFITKIRENGAAAVDKSINEGDQILEVNGVDVRSVTHLEAVNLFLTSGPKVDLVVKQDAEAAILATALCNGAISAQKNGNVPHDTDTSNEETHTDPYIPTSFIIAATGIAAICVGLYLGYRKFRR